MVVGPTTLERIDSLLATDRSANFAIRKALRELATTVDQLRIGLAVLEHAITDDTGPRIGG